MVRHETDPERRAIDPAVAATAPRRPPGFIDMGADSKSPIGPFLDVVLTGVGQPIAAGDMERDRRLGVGSPGRPDNSSGDPESLPEFVIHEVRDLATAVAAELCLPVVVDSAQ
jgi:hypothetical protein